MRFLETIEEGIKLLTMRVNHKLVSTEEYVGNHISEETESEFTGL